VACGIVTIPIRILLSLLVSRLEHDHALRNVQTVRIMRSNKRSISGLHSQAENALRGEPRFGPLTLGLGAVPDEPEAG
jgi:hypothetical protein